MKQIIIKIPEEAFDFVEEFVERIGGEILIPEHEAAKKQKIKPLDFFGSWKQIPLDPETYRKKIWRKTQEF